MEYNLAFFALFVLGLIVGSFLNVVILRFNTGMSVSKGRSVCFACGKSLTWRELIPLVSFLAQKGACRGCGSKISWQYPLVELATGIAFVVAYMVAPMTFGLVAIILSLYIVITVYDLRHKVIPDFFSYGAALVALCMIAIDSTAAGHVDFWRIIAGPMLFLFFWFFWKVSRGTWMGLGDGKLALSIGWALGFWQGIAALLLSFWIGAALSLLIMAVQALWGIRSGRKGLRMRSQIPFGPFLVIGFLIALIWGVDIQAILTYLAL